MGLRKLWVMGDDGDRHHPERVRKRTRVFSVSFVILPSVLFVKRARRASSGVQKGFRHWFDASRGIKSLDFGLYML
jgi:hypothetical protein